MIEKFHINDKYLILTHKGPDGDAISSSLAMYTYLIDMGVAPKNIEVYIPKMSESLKFIDKKRVTTDQISETYKDVVIVVDVSSSDRIEGIDLIEGNFSRCVIIDHHEKNTNFLKTRESIINPEAASCTSIIDSYFKDKIRKKENKKQFSEYIVIGILSDTRGLRARNTTTESKAIVEQYSEEYGIETNEIIEELETMDLRTNVLFEYCKRRLDYKDGVMYTYLLQSDLKPEETELKNLNHKAIIQALMKNGKVGEDELHSLLLLIEKKDGTYKGSIRTTLKNIDLNDECFKLIKQGKILKGGGHRDSSGITIDNNNRKPKQIAEDIIAELFMKFLESERCRFLNNIKIQPNATEKLCNYTKVENKGERE